LISGYSRVATRSCPRLTASARATQEAAHRRGLRTVQLPAFDVLDNLTAQQLC